jgi:hypothetical protein
MRFLILFFVLLSSGSVLGTVYTRRRYEEFLPLTFCSLTAVVYLFALFDQMRAGVWAACAVAAAAYLLSAVRVVRTKDWRAPVQRFLTPAFFIFAVFFMVAALCNLGRVCYIWDEFSHWADIVRVYYTTDTFGFAASVHALAPSYPPAMGIFQYFALHIFGEYQDWILYFAYQLFLFALTMPFFSRLTHQTPIQNLFLGVAAFALPILIYDNAYHSVYIDPFLGSIFGFCIAVIFLHQEESCWKTAALSAGLFILVLTKEAGFGFACMAIVIYLLDRAAACCRAKKENLLPSGQALRRSVMQTLIPLAMLLAARYSWIVNARLHGYYPPFATPIDFRDAISVVIHHEGYRWMVIYNFLQFCISKKLTYGFLSVTVIELLLLFFAAFVLYLFFRSRHRTSSEKMRDYWVLFSVFFLFILYALSLVLCYMYKFSEYEAVRLASCQRYLNVFFAMWAFLLFVGIVNRASEWKDATGAALLCAGILFLVPQNEIPEYLTRVSVSYSKQQIAPYAQQCDMVMDYLDAQGSAPETKVYLIAQESTGFEYYYLHSSLRPYLVDNVFAWSLGEPFYDGDIWTKTETCSQLQETLQTGDYEYVLLYHVNDYFRENFSAAFADPSNLTDGQLYAMDETTGLLTLVAETPVSEPVEQSVGSL